jgi:hypothetical protein
MLYKIIEKANPLAVHALCHTKEGAERWITVLAPEYCKCRLFANKNLTPQSFVIVPPLPTRRTS